MANNSNIFGVAIVGCGTVGGASATILTRDIESLRSRTGLDIRLKYLVDVNFDHARKLDLNEKLFCSNIDKALADPEVRVVVELIGGTKIARQVIEKSIQAGKNIVTANKALLATCGKEIYALARKHKVCVSLEASCAGGIPIIRALYDGLIANRIDALYGIVNGTCNYILTGMTQQGQPYDKVLAAAQKLGLAEADPTLDVGGGDSAHKLTILASLAFGQCVDLDKIYVQGIDKLELCDITYGQELGYVIKLLAIAQRQPDGLSLRVRPAFISKEHPLAWVNGPFNAVSVYGSANGHTMYYGRGAGGLPTASAVVADIVSIAIGTAGRVFDQLGIWPDKTTPANQLPVSAVRSKYYLRMICKDQPGVFAQIAAVLAANKISISSLLQHEPVEGTQNVPVVITTHKVLEGDVQKAMESINSLETIVAPGVCIGIVDEHPEQI